MTDTKHPAHEMPAHTGPLWELTALGQSVWLDYIRRGILENGELEGLINEYAVRGVTSNPAIFEQAISGSDDYDDLLEELSAEGAEPIEAYEKLAIADIQSAADLFRAIYDESNGADGFVSLEVSPELAHDTAGTLLEARRLWREVARPNVMIKVPGTEEGVPAIETLLAEGINVNITLLFSIAAYERVMEAYLKALERRAERGEALDRIASVASFFVSRVDVAVDKLLEERIAAATSDEERERARSLLGKAAIANAKLAYERFGQVFAGERFARLQRAGALVQRPLWASTSTKNPAYRDVVYVEELIGPHTVDTMPLATLEAFADHGVARRTVDQGVDEAHRQLAALAELGIDLDAVTDALLVEAVEKFVTPFRKLLKGIDEKLTELATRS
jgi:transaldolase